MLQNWRLHVEGLNRYITYMPPVGGYIAITPHDGLENDMVKGYGHTRESAINDLKATLAAREDSDE